MAALLDDGHGVEGEVQEGAGAQHHQHDVIPGDVIDPLLPLLRREHQIAQEDDEGHKRGQPDLLQPAGEQGDVETEQGKGRQDQRHRRLGCALPDADVGLLIVLFHDGFQIHRLGGSRFLFEQIHSIPPWGKSVCSKGSLWEGAGREAD